MSVIESNDENCLADFWVYNTLFCNSFGLNISSKESDVSYGVRRQRERPMRSDGRCEIGEKLVHVLNLFQYVFICNYICLFVTDQSKPSAYEVESVVFTLGQSDNAPFL